MHLSPTTAGGRKQTRLKCHLTNSRKNHSIHFLSLVIVFISLLNGSQPQRCIRAFIYLFHSYTAHYDTGCGSFAHHKVKNEEVKMSECLFAETQSLKSAPPKTRSR